MFFLDSDNFSCKLFVIKKFTILASDNKQARDK